MDGTISTILRPPHLKHLSCSLHVFTPSVERSGHEGFKKGEHDGSTERSLIYPFVYIATLRKLKLYLLVLKTLTFKTFVVPLTSFELHCMISGLFSVVRHRRSTDRTYQGSGWRSVQEGWQLVSPYVRTIDI